MRTQASAQEHLRASFGTEIGDADFGSELKAIAQVQATVRELPGGKYSDEVSDNLAVILSQGEWTHDFPITFEFAKQLGLHVSSEMPPEVLEVMTLYPQPVRHYPTVEYLPGRRMAERRIELGEFSANA